jgi:hypothetical protein
VTLPQEIRLATDCAAALDRGDKKAAKRLAQDGLRLALELGNEKWTRRFQHLLRVATGGAIEAPPYEPPTCSFCSKRAVKVVAGPKTFICDACVDRCVSEHLAASPIRRVEAHDIACSFCGRRSEEPLFAGQEYFICTSCVSVCVDTLRD